MAENADDGVGDNEKAQAGAGSQKSQAMTSNLPMVLAPKLGAGDEDVDDIQDEAAADTAGTAAPAAASNSSRFMMLAASVAFAAAFGSFVGSVSGSGLAHFLYPGAAPAAGATVSASAEATRDTKLQLAELSTIKANLDSTSRNTTSQFAKLSDRLDRLDQRVASAASAVETTGSIATPAATPTPVVPATAPKLADRILPDWIVQDVQDGRALVQSRYGGMFDVGEGSTLPGVGRVDQIKRQDGQWMVLTARGVITSGR